MRNFVDKWFPDSPKLAYQFEQDLHQCVEDYSDKSERDRKIYVETLKYLDGKLNDKLSIDSFSISYNLITKAYPYLLTCDLDKFWSTGIPRLKEVRQQMWDSIL